MTTSYELQHKHTRKTKYPPRLKQRRLTPDQVARIRSPDAPTLKILAQEFNISEVAVFYAKHRYTYKDLP